MSFFWRGVSHAWHLLVTGNPYLDNLIVTTLKVAAVSTGVSLLIGLPIALLLGLGRFRGRTIALVLANVGLSLPPVLVGLVLALLMFPESVLGRYHWLFTLRGVYIAQTALGLPIIVALGAAAIRALPPGLIDQARALHASRWRLWLLALREARLGILTATVAAVGSALSEVGAVVLVGGNIAGVDQTLASAALEKIGAGDFDDAAAIGIVLLGLILLVIGVLTVLQYAGERTPRSRPLRDTLSDASGPLAVHGPS